MKPKSTAYTIAPTVRGLGGAPEMRLVAALLDDAIECLVGNVDARGGARRCRFVEARDWLCDDTRGWPFAFANVCDLLNLDAARVRRRLEAIVPGWRRGSGEGWGAARRPCRGRADRGETAGTRVEHVDGNMEVDHEVRGSTPSGSVESRGDGVNAEGAGRGRGRFVDAVASHGRRIVQP